MVSDEYLCGLFDGEGCISLSLAKKGYMSLTVSVAMCSRNEVAALYERFGGFFEDGKRTTATGSVYYRWSVQNAKSIEALNVFAAGCLNKAEVARLAIPVAVSMRDNETKQPLSVEEKKNRILIATKISSINQTHTPVAAFDKTLVDRYLKRTKLGGGKSVLVDGVKYESQREAGRAIGVTSGAIWHGMRTGKPVKGRKVERVE